MKLIGKTKSVCRECQRAIPAEIFEWEGKVFIKSRCGGHGETISGHVWDDPEIYRGMSELKMGEGNALQVVIDTTLKCNLHCKVCFARANEQTTANEFKKEDILRLPNVRQVFLSGGEPTTRKDLPEIIRFCVKNGKQPIIFTNGLKLANKKYAKSLQKAGLRSVLLQLDTLNEADSVYIRGKKLTVYKLKALENLKELNIPVSIWTVIVKDKNLKDLGELHNFLFKYPNIKTISAIPIWKIGRFEEKDFVPSSEIIRKLSRMYNIPKSDFIATTQLVCNLDRLLSFFRKEEGKLFGKCMLKGLIVEHEGDRLSISKVFDINKINEKFERLFAGGAGYLKALRFFGSFVGEEIIINFFKNKIFRRIAVKFLLNLRYLFLGRYLLISPFRFITVGIFPNSRNIDLNFIKDCNSYALSCSDYALRPACLHYINQEKK